MIYKYIIIILCFILFFANPLFGRTVIYRVDSSIEKKYDGNSSETQIRNQYATDVNTEKPEDDLLKIRTQFAELNALLYQIKEEIRVIKGRLEEKGYFIKRKMQAFDNSQNKLGLQFEKLEKEIKSNSRVISDIKQYLNLETSAKSNSEKFDEKKISAKNTTKKGTVTKKQSEEELYVFAKMEFDRGNYKTAQKKFQEMIETYPDSANADNAQFWIGEIYYREKWYAEAILEYQKVMENYPKGNKIRASLLKQGISFYYIGDKTNARLILNELIRKYPQSNESKIAKKKLKGFGN